WGDPLPPAVALKPGIGRTEFKAAVDVADGRCAKVTNNMRALDVLDIPFCDEALQAVITCFDEGGRLDDLYMTYNAGFNEQFPDPTVFACHLEEGGVPG